MTETVTLATSDGVARIQIDDGKANALGPDVLAALGRALDAAEKDAAAVVLTGRPDRFSAGFDLSVMGAGAAAARDMVSAGAELCLRLLEFPKPVVAACSGHAIAAGVLVVLCCDWRLGARGAFKLGLNEVAIGMALPHFAREIARMRLSRRHLVRATVHAEIYAPDAAVDAGYLDAVVEPEALLGEAHAQARRLAGLDARAFAVTKRALHADGVALVRKQLAADLARMLPGR